MTNEQKTNGIAPGGLWPNVTIELNNETIFILGRPNFWCGQLSRNLRELGHDIPKKAEEEQAYVIYWMLGLYEQYRDTWRAEFESYFKRA